MKQCVDCQTDEHEGACNWLDWMVVEADGKCPHCGGPVVHLEPTPWGKLLDEMK